MITISTGVGSKIISKIVSKIVKKKLGINGKVTLDHLEIDESKEGKDLVDVMVHVRMTVPMADVDKLLEKF